ncbi:unnamed protein product, partial [Medioppia subpectinata]
MSQAVISLAARRSPVNSSSESTNLINRFTLIPNRSRWLLSTNVCITCRSPMGPSKRANASITSCGRFPKSSTNSGSSNSRNGFRRQLITSSTDSMSDDTCGSVADCLVADGCTIDGRKITSSSSSNNENDECIDGGKYWLTLTVRPNSQSESTICVHTCVVSTASSRVMSCERRCKYMTRNARRSRVVRIDLDDETDDDDTEQLFGKHWSPTPTPEVSAVVCGRQHHYRCRHPMVSTPDGSAVGGSGGRVGALFKYSQSSSGQPFGSLDTNDLNFSVSTSDLDFEFELFEEFRTEDTQRQSQQTQSAEAVAVKPLPPEVVTIDEIAVKMIEEYLKNDEMCFSGSAISGRQSNNRWPLKSTPRWMSQAVISLAARRSPVKSLSESTNLINRFTLIPNRSRWLLSTNVCITCRSPMGPSKRANASITSCGRFPKSSTNSGSSNSRYGFRRQLITSSTDDMWDDTCGSVADCLVADGCTVDGRKITSSSSSCPLVRTAICVHTCVVSTASSRVMSCERRYKYMTRNARRSRVVRIDLDEETDDDDTEQLFGKDWSTTPTPEVSAIVCGRQHHYRCRHPMVSTPDGSAVGGRGGRVGALFKYSQSEPTSGQSSSGQPFGSLDTNDLNFSVSTSDLDLEFELFEEFRTEDTQRQSQQTQSAEAVAVKPLPPEVVTIDEIAVKMIEEYLKNDEMCFSGSAISGRHSKSRPDRN